MSSSIRASIARPFSDASERISATASVDALAQAERRRLELHPPGLDLREVEDVVDDGEQRLAGRADDRRPPRAARASRSLSQQQPAHADHARSSACGSRGSSPPGTCSWPHWPRRPPRGPPARWRRAGRCRARSSPAARTAGAARPPTQSNDRWSDASRGTPSVPTALVAGHQRHAHHRSDPVAREGSAPARPGVVVVDHARLERLHHLSRQTLRRAQRAGESPPRTRPSRRGSGASPATRPACRCSHGRCRVSSTARASTSLSRSSTSSRCITPSDVSCKASSSAFCSASSSVRSATRCSRPSRVSRSWPVMSLNAVASVPISSRRRHRCLAREVARGDRSRRLGDRQDRLGDPARGEVDADAHQQHDDHADRADLEGELAAPARTPRAAPPLPPWRRRARAASDRRRSPARPGSWCTGPVPTSLRRRVSMPREWIAPA